MYRVMRAQAQFEAATGNATRALEIYGGLVSDHPAESLADAQDISNLYRDAAFTCRRAGRTADAASFDVRRRELWRMWGGKFPRSEFIQRQLLAAR